MIARIWHGIVPTSKSAEYLELMQKFAVRDYTATPGNRGAWCLHRTEGDVRHFVNLHSGTTSMRSKASPAKTTNGQGTTTSIPST
jgi:hypothetical protein